MHRRVMMMAHNLRTPQWGRRHLTLTKSQALKMAWELYRKEEQERRERQAKLHELVTVWGQAWVERWEKLMG